MNQQQRLGMRDAVAIRQLVNESQHKVISSTYRTPSPSPNPSPSPSPNPSPDPNPSPPPLTLALALTLIALTLTPKSGPAAGRAADAAGARQGVQPCPRV